MPPAMCPMWVPTPDPTMLLLIQLTANAPRKSAQEGSSAGGAATMTAMQETSGSFLLSGLSLTTVAIWKVNHQQKFFSSLIVIQPLKKIKYI